MQQQGKQQQQPQWSQQGQQGQQGQQWTEQYPGGFIKITQEELNCLQDIKNKNPDSVLAKSNVVDLAQQAFQKLTSGQQQQTQQTS